MEYPFHTFSIITAIALSQYQANFSQAIEMRGAILLPNAEQITGIGYTSLASNDLPECSLQCLSIPECFMMGFDGNNMIFDNDTLVQKTGVCYMFGYSEYFKDSGYGAILGVEYYIYLVRAQGILPLDCKAVLDRGFTMTGTYLIRVDQALYVVYCDMDIAGGGWTVYQKRYDGSVDFNKGWMEYTFGFGDPRMEFWAGNELVHHLTTLYQGVGGMELRIELQSWDGTWMQATYSHFILMGKSDDYEINTSLQYDSASTAADVLISLSQVGWGFTTSDMDNDGNPWFNFAHIYGGGWWFSNGNGGNLNGVYNATGQRHGLSWHDPNYSHKATTMMIRPAP